jgi:hypothetical protein
MIWAAFLLTACSSASFSDPDALPEDYDYASGDRAIAVTLNNVVLQVENVQAIQGDVSLVPGYVYVVVTISVSNQSSEPVSAMDFQLVDEYLNLYTSWQNNAPFAAQLTAMPVEVGPGQSATGDQVFLAPVSALQANLKLRWESAAHQSRIDIRLGNMAVTPLPTPAP